MSLVLDIGTMKYRENPNQPWRPLVIKANMNWESMADIYDPDNGTYEIGQYVLEDGVMYRCIYPIDTPETWTPAHWTEINIGDELFSLQDSIASEATTRASEDTLIRNTLTQLDAEKADEESLALRRSGATNTGAQIEAGTFFYLDGTLKHATATIAQNASFTAQNCEKVTAGGLNALKTESGPGYCKMPDGTLIQWGGLTGATGMVVTFPESFVNTGYGLSITAHYNVTTSVRCILSDALRSTNSFTLYAYDVTTNTGSTATNIPVYWLAIGRWK